MIYLQKLLKPKALRNKEQMYSFLFSLLWYIQLRCFPLQFREMAGPMGQSGDSGMISLHIICRMPLSHCGNFCYYDLTDHYSSECSVLIVVSCRWFKLYLDEGGC